MLGVFLALKRAAEYAGMFEEDKNMQKALILSKSSLYDRLRNLGGVQRRM